MTNMDAFLDHIAHQGDLEKEAELKEENQLKKQNDEVGISSDDVKAIYYIQRYKFLTIEQVWRILDARKADGKPLSQGTIGRWLNRLEKGKYISSFGDKRVGHDKVPKVYYCTHHGYDLLIGNRIPVELMGTFKRRSKPSWSPVFFHRISLVSLLISLELSLKKHPYLEMVHFFMEYNTSTIAGETHSETADFVSDEKTSFNKIIPDAVVIIKSHRKNTQGLFMIEMDTGSETILSSISPNYKPNTIHNRMKKYDKYLLSGNYKRKYREYGDFMGFRMLFVTSSGERINNIKKSSKDLDQSLDAHYLFNTFDEVKNDFFCGTWRNRSIQDDSQHFLFKE